MMLEILFGVAIAGAALCLVASLWLMYKATQAASKADKAASEVASKVAADKTVAAGALDLGDLVKSLATLAESLVKGGPALWSLIGSLLFLVIAGFAAGLFVPK